MQKWPTPNPMNAYIKLTSNNTIGGGKESKCDKEWENAQKVIDKDDY